MRKVLIALNEEEIVQLERILEDDDNPEQQALLFLKKVIGPKLKKQTNCLKKWR